MKSPLDFLKKAKKNEILAFTVFVCIGIFVGYYFIFLSPVTAKLSSLLQDVSRLQHKLDKAELSINNVPRMKKELEGLREKAEFYSRKLPKEEEFPAILESLSEMARSTGVKITKILPLKGAGTISEDKLGREIYSQQEILINAQCGYHQLGTFIAELENAERFMDVSDIKIEAGKLNPKRHNVQLTVKTFILKSEAE